MCPSPITTIPNPLSTSPVKPQQRRRWGPSDQIERGKPSAGMALVRSKQESARAHVICTKFLPRRCGHLLPIESSHGKMRSPPPLVLDSCDPARHFLGLTLGFARTMCLASLQNCVISFLNGMGFPIGILDPIVFCTNREIDRFRRQRMRCRQYFSR